MARIGTASLSRLDDGTVVCNYADPVIGVTPEFLDQVDESFYGPDGVLKLDTAGTFRYRRVGQVGDPVSHFLFERVD